LRAAAQVLQLEGCNIEAIACLAAHHFYSDQPEIALRYYRRLLQMGVVNTELWNNLGLCCFYSSQYDMALTCFERALQLADDTSLPDVWCARLLLVWLAPGLATTHLGSSLHDAGRSVGLH
jgi:Tfp pilus assembly protein PilF